MKKAYHLVQLQCLNSINKSTKWQLVNKDNKTKSEIFKGASDEIITYNKKMKEVIKYAEQAANLDSNVLILGETGTGKGLLAKYIYRTSTRKNGSFISIYCPGIPNELLETKLSLYSNGAFTGDTLFIGEIADLSPELQVKLMQFLKERKSARIIASTNQDLRDMIKKGSFREDLFFQLNEVEINIPPLRERPEDIRPSVYFFLNKFNKKYNVRRYISAGCIDILGQYAWPGNVRELENLIERLVVTVQENVIKPSHLPKMFHRLLQFEIQELSCF